MEGKVGLVQSIRQGLTARMLFGKVGMGNCVALLYSALLYQNKSKTRRFTGLGRGFKGQSRVPQDEDPFHSLSEYIMSSLLVRLTRENILPYLVSHCGDV